MIKQFVDLTPMSPITRSKAAEIAKTASSFQCVITLEQNHVILNVKSMLGLLSQTMPNNGKMTLICSGEDEKEAMLSLLEIFTPFCG